MNHRKEIQKIGETLLAFIAFALLPCLPRRLIFIMSRILGSLASAVPIRERRIAIANLNLVYGDSISALKKRTIIRNSLCSISLMVLDCFWFLRKTKDRLRTFVKFDPSCELYFKTKPSIVITCHFGNWEVLGVAVAFRKHPCVTVARPLTNAFLNNKLNSFRQMTGQHIVSTQGAVRALMAALRKGKRVALLIDQNTLPEDGGEFVKFFGLDVPISSIAARLSVRTGAPIVFVFCAPEDDGHYRAWASGPLEPKAYNGDSRKLNQDIANEMEKQIRSTPEYWIWTYKRWKWVPRGRSHKSYPYYAIPYVGRNMSTKS